MRLLLATLLVGMAFAGAAHAATTLPGGATSLTEAHDDWTVRCEVTQNLVQCAAQQEQLSAQTKQRVLAIEMRDGPGGIAGTLVLPFGLMLSKGAVLTVDNTAASAVLPFQTCLPAGCLVLLAISPDWEKAMRAGTALAISAEAVSGDPANFSISLKGFSSALDRVVELTK